MYHLDVNQLIALTLPEKNILNEKYLLSSYSLPLGGGTMTLSGTSIKDFEDWVEVEVYESE